MLVSVKSFVILSLSLGLAASFYVFYRRRGEIVGRICVASLPVAVVITLLLFLSFIVFNLTQEFAYIWAAARLAPLVGLWHGYPLYSGLGDGPILGTMYGPLAYLPFAPVVLFSSPTNVVLVGQVIAALLGIGPVIWLMFRDMRLKGLTGHHAVIGVVLFAALVFSSFSDQLFFAYMDFGVHADAPALALGTMACICLYGDWTTPSKWPLFLSTTFAVLAVWAKQIEIGIFVALGLYVLIAYGRDMLFRFVGIAFLMGIGISGLILLIFGFENTILNILTIPSKHPWYEPGSPENKASFFTVIRLAGPLFLVLAIGLVGTLGSRLHKSKDIASFFRENPWSIFLLASFCMVPTSILGGSKVGGTPNSFHFLHYLAVLCALLAASMHSRSTTNWTNRVGRVMPYILIGIFLWGSMPLIRALNQFSDIYKNTLEQAYSIAKKHPDKYFFPWMPLSTLLAEGKLYHFDDGVWSRELAGYASEIQDYRRYTPRNIEYALLPSEITWAAADYPTDQPLFLRYFPECRPVPETPVTAGLAGEWAVWRCN